MDFAFSAEQEMLRNAARDFLVDKVPPERVVALAETDPAERAGAGVSEIWASLGDLGWLDLEDFLDEAPLFEEAGRALLPVPFLPTVALGSAGAGLRAAGDTGLGGGRLAAADVQAVGDHG